MRKTPNILEMVSYTFYFPAITSGPLFFYKDYEHFIVQGPPDNKSCILPVLRKTINGSIAMALNVMGRKRFDPKTIAEPRFINNTNIDQKMTGCIAGLLLTKSKFYFAWSISDALCNVSGFGYKRPECEDDDDDMSSFVGVGGERGKCQDVRVGGARGKCHDAGVGVGGAKGKCLDERKANSTHTGFKEHPDEQDEDDLLQKSSNMDPSEHPEEGEDDDLSQYKAVTVSTCASRGNCKSGGSKVRWSVSLDQLETIDSTHQDWNGFHFWNAFYWEDEEFDEWEVTSNIRPAGIELAPNLRSVTDNWNIQTHNWIKYVCYDRCPESLSLISSYVLIALWHGFYPGYWISFVQAAILTKTSRLVRRVVRPLFLAPGENYNTPNPEMTIKKRYYDFMTWFTTSVFIAYNMAPFYLLEFEASVAFYASVGWIGHIIVGGAFVVLSIIDRSIEMPEMTPSIIAGALAEMSDVISEPEGGLEGFEGTWSTHCIRCKAKKSRESRKRLSDEAKVEEKVE